MLVQACAESDFDVATGVCSHVIWVVNPGVLPPLSVGDALPLVGQILGVCALAWAYKAVRRYLNPKI